MRTKRKITQLVKVKVPGFTMQETIVAMVITGLVASLSFTVLRYYQQLFIHNVKTGNQQTEINMLQQVLQEDMRLADKVSFNSNMVCSSSAEDIRYVFLEDTIIRNSILVSDTFKLRFEKPQLQISPHAPELVSYIMIKCYNNDLEIPVSVAKKYPLCIQLEKED